MRILPFLSLLLAGAAVAAPSPQLADNAAAILGHAAACHMDAGRLETADKAALKRLVAATPEAEKDEALMTYASEKSEALARQLAGGGVDCSQVEAAVRQLEAIRPVTRAIPPK